MEENHNSNQEFKNVDPVKVDSTYKDFKKSEKKEKV